MKENIKDNKESRRVQMTKKLLRESVIELMEQKPLNKISIKDICDNADVNRTTFYKYYGDQFELVKEAEDEVLEKLGEFLGNLKSDTLVISMLETFLYYMHIPTCQLSPVKPKDYLLIPVLRPLFHNLYYHAQQHPL